MTFGSNANLIPLRLCLTEQGAKRRVPQPNNKPPDWVACCLAFLTLIDALYFVC